MDNNKKYEGSLLTKKILEEEEKNKEDVAKIIFNNILIGIGIIGAFLMLIALLLIQLMSKN